MSTALSLEIANALESNKNKWWTIDELAKEIFDKNSKGYRRQIKNNMGNARSILENRGMFVIPLIESGKKEINAYKVAQAEDAEYIVKEICRKNGMATAYSKRLFRALEITKEEGFLETETVEQLPHHLQEQIA